MRIQANCLSAGDLITKGDPGRMISYRVLETNGRTWRDGVVCMSLRGEVDGITHKYECYADKLFSVHN